MAPPFCRFFPRSHRFIALFSILADNGDKRRRFRSDGQGDQLAADIGDDQFRQFFQ